MGLTEITRSSEPRTVKTTVSNRPLSVRPNANCLGSFLNGAPTTTSPHADVGSVPAFPRKRGGLFGGAGAVAEILRRLQPQRVRVGEHQAVTLHRVDRRRVPDRRPRPRAGSRTRRIPPSRGCGAFRAVAGSGGRRDPGGHAPRPGGGWCSARRLQRSAERERRAKERHFGGRAALKR